MRSTSRLALVLALLPFGLLVYLVVADKGAVELKIMLAGVFVILAVAYVAMAFFRAGATRGKVKGKVGVTEVDIEFENPRESSED
jgi:hypothetical protein